jgi:tetratricopeptide (TPR) repeat protein
MTTFQNAKDYQNYLHEKLLLNPKDINALIQLGALEFEYFHETDKALAILETAIAIDPLNVDAKFWVAMCLYFDCFEYTKALDILIDALKLDPKRPDCLSLIGSIIREIDGPIEKAIEYVQKALIYAPDWPMLRCQLARLLLKVGKIRAAEEEAQKAFQMQPLDPEIIKNEVERYYESVVTGRYWPDLQKSRTSLFTDIENAKRLSPN